MHVTIHHDFQNREAGHHIDTRLHVRPHRRCLLEQIEQQVHAGSKENPNRTTGTTIHKVHPWRTIQKELAPVCSEQRNGR